MQNATCDSDELADIYARYAHALFRRSMSLLRHEAEAHDAVQDACARYWAKRGSFKGDASLFSYLYRIVTHICIDKLRRQKRFRHESYEDETRGENGGAHRLADASLLAQLCSGMRAEVITVAVMLFVDGLTQEEIALSLSVSRKTVGKRLKAFKAHAQRRARELGLQEEIDATAS